MKLWPAPTRLDVQGVPVLLETCNALPLVGVTVSQRTGTTLDPPGRSGLTRLLSRLMRRTAGGRSLLSIESGLDRLGASLGTDASYSTVSLQGVVLARSLPGFIDLLGDALGKPSLDDQEMERLVRETRAELVDLRDHDRSLAFRALRQRLFAPHPYAHSPSGTLSSIAALSSVDVRRHFARTVTRENLVLGFAGALGPSQATTLAERLLQAVPSGAAQKEELKEPVYPEGRHLVVVQKPERTQTQLAIGLAGTCAQDPDHTALVVANTVFGGTFSSRLMQTIRVEKGWSYGAYASLSVDRRRQPLILSAFPQAADAAACTRLQLQMLDGLVERGITARELSGAKKYLVRSFAFAIDTATKRLGLALDELLLELPCDYYRHYADRVQQVTLAQANDALRRRIDPKRLVVAAVCSESSVQQALAESIADLSTSEHLSYDSDEL